MYTKYYAPLEIGDHTTAPARFLSPETDVFRPAEPEAYKDELYEFWRHEGSGRIVAIHDPLAVCRNTDSTGSEWILLDRSGAAHRLGGSDWCPVSGEVVESAMATYVI